MKSPSIRQLFEYCNERRGRRLVPDREDIDPAAIRGMLADSFILAAQGRSAHSFRVAGTRVCALFGRELKSELFLNLWSQDSRSELKQLISIVANESLAVV